MCARKPYYEVPIGMCSAWSFNHGSKTCWMKTGNSTHPNHNGDTSGVVTSRGATSINASCSAVPVHERIACPDVVASSGAAGATECAALGCCYDESAAADGADGSPACYYYAEARGSPPPCSLNGVKNAAGTACVCDKGWEGEHCERLRLKPANLSEGFNSWSTSAPGTSSWGATQLRGDDGLYHTWVDEMSMSCGLSLASLPLCLSVSLFLCLSVSLYCQSRFVFTGTGINGYENNMQIVHFTSHEVRSE